jgi:hypothetical protein
MTTRGWHKERTLTTIDTVGRAIAVTTGLTRDSEGHSVAVIAIGDGPTAIIRHLDDYGDRTELVVNAARTAEDLRALVPVAPVQPLRARL